MTRSAKRPARRHACVAIAAALAVSCASKPPPTKDARVVTAPPPSASAAAVETLPALSGQVRLADGAPAGGAVVALVPHQELEYPDGSPDVPMVIADSLGRYAFPAETAPGHFAVTATLGTKAAGGYGGAHDIAPASALKVDIVLGQQGFAIGGTVRDAGGAPVKGALVAARRVSDNEDEAFMTSTDAAGHYELQLPGDTTYYVVADVRGLPRAYRRIDPVAQTVDLRLDPAPAPRPTEAEIKSYLAEQALPLATIQPGNGTADLAALKKMIGDAHIVAIGEPVHGSSEFWVLRHRLIELLTTELGFTTVALEAGWSDALSLDDYVVSGRGDPSKGLFDLYYWYPNTQETLGLLRWMRRYNQDRAHTKKLRFLGFDAEFASHGVSALVAYLDKVDVPLAARARTSLSSLSDVSAEGTYGGLPPAEQEKTRQGLGDVLARFESERAKWTARAGAPAWATARQHARMIQRTEAMYRDFTLRDRAMADTVDDIIAGEPKGAKIVLLAHNMHVAAQRWQTSEMGTLLRERHGNDYFVIGTTFGTGSLTAIGAKKRDKAQGPLLPEVFTLGPPPPNGLEAGLALAQKSPLLLDLRQSSGKVGDWLSSKISTRSVGGIFRGEANSDTPCAPKKSYDALVYVDKVTASHVNPGAH